ncbi:unnamed protein product [Rangifer tarandus platyrhynchus]|uniref:Uncharacterized protein n=1 Tax=Rangifer tarandus platyrhynchus TaxID=3082113 RepID=A0AC59ZFH9_RANTA
MGGCSRKRAHSEDIPLLKMQLGSSESALSCFPTPENVLCAKAYPIPGHRHHQRSLTCSKSPSRLSTPWLTAPTAPRFGHPSSSSPHWSASLVQVEPGASLTFRSPEPFLLQHCAAWSAPHLLHPHILRAGGVSDVLSSPVSNALCEPGSVYSVN